VLTFCCAHREPFGLVALESQACGTPVLAVNEGGYRDTIISHKTGFLLPRKIKPFALKAMALLKNSEEIKLLGIQAVKYIHENWNWQIRGKQLEKKLEEIIRTRK
jgi:glycosyltransferase involved in cell wall biosynthesis